MTAASSLPERTAACAALSLSKGMVLKVRMLAATEANASCTRRAWGPRS